MAAPVIVVTTRAPTASTMQFAGIGTEAVVEAPESVTSVSITPNWMFAPFDAAATVTSAGANP